MGRTAPLEAAVVALASVNTINRQSIRAEYRRDY